MNSNGIYKSEIEVNRSVEITLLLVALFGFWEFTLASWPFQSGEFGDLWPVLTNNYELSGLLEAINVFSASNSRILEVIPTLIAEACFVSYVAGRTKLFKIFGLMALILFAATLHLTNFNHGNHPYYDFLMLSVIVLSSGCLHSLRVAYALTYFMCSLLKINSGWITGGFFLTAKGYLPFGSPELVPYLTNLMIVFQMFGCFFLLGRNLNTRRIFASLFLLFHLYSVIIAGSRFSWSTFPFIVLLYMTPQEGDKKLASPRLIAGVVKQLLDDVRHSLRATHHATCALIVAFLSLQILSYFDVISEKRTFNMFSEATACVVTVAGQNFKETYGHPVGSSACFKEQIIRSTKKELCPTRGDFDLRIEVSKNGSTYKVDYEQLSVCNNEVRENNLPVVSSEYGYTTQDFVSPNRSSEKVTVETSSDGRYILIPDQASPLKKEFWASAKVGELPSRENENTSSPVTIAYKTILLISWVFICFWIAASFYRGVKK